MDGRLNLLAAAVLSAALAACGGGGGGGSSDNSPAPTPPPETPKGSSGDSGTLDVAVYTGEKLAIFNAINEARAKVGLAPVKQNIKLDTAAQGHAGYIHLNGHSEGHFQTEGKPGYTGQGLAARIMSTSYFAPGVGEVIALDNTPVTSLLNTIYHRIPLISSDTIDIGVGVDTFDIAETLITPNLVTVIDYGYVDVQNALLNEVGYWTWPVEGANDLPVSYRESPNPAPDLQTLGYAVSISVNPNDMISSEAFTLNCAGQDLPVRLITAMNDIHKIVMPNWIFLQPEIALPHDSICTASFQGNSQQLGRFNKTWSFTTAKQ